jgi:hypothetical protein
MLPIVRSPWPFAKAHVYNLAIYKSYFHLRLNFEIVGEPNDFSQNSERETKMETARMALIG